ncbi:SDR family oxidoreductase [Bradyrhizobium sp. Ash2021]|uniref:SDR family oxidoreductase n=1 Tax=Bradyrhizobium sp. Ash2021 TaxID=2954771 RepID=UPI0028168D64|nr:SDR family oxidoreductase [Bradyrhizobium sp. Ash2021]WMT76342.1 SDR family oxidoreductase [Bradyrhizobium sp. Ash2021]WMT76453.1 SDR family oxidoreductase [Bradyrhizobium sp. Ash2021]
MNKATDTPDSKQVYGMTDEQLAKRESVYRNDLLAGKTILISGGGSGIGRTMAWLCGRLGATVVICGRKPERLELTAAPMRSSGLKVETFACNIRNPDEPAALMDKLFSEHGGIDVLVNNAGGQFPQPAIDFAAKGWNAVIETNLTGTWNMMQAAGRHWRDSSRPGSIVNIITVVDRGQPGVAHTCAARAGVAALTRTVAVEWAPFHIRVNCVAPGGIETEGLNNYPPAALDMLNRSNPMLRRGEGWDVAEAMVYLAAPSGKFITGETLNVDGGGRLWGEFWIAGKPAYFDAA